VTDDTRDTLKRLRTEATTAAIVLAVTMIAAWLVTTFT
jgi:hypothetical protein